MHFKIIENIAHDSKNGLLYDLTYFGANVCRRVRRFDMSVTGLVHVLVSRVLAQISAGSFGYRWQADGLLHFSLVPVRFTGQYFSVLHGQ